MRVSHEVKINRNMLNVSILHIGHWISGPLSQGRCACSSTASVFPWLAVGTFLYSLVSYP